jgi:S1-C subfamily serine protease
VESVTSGSPAATAGIQASTTKLNDNGQEATVGGDLIIGFNGQTVSSADELIADVANEGAVGQPVTLTILRSGKQIQVQVTPGIRPSS